MAEKKSGSEKGKDGDTVIIKKYANRRLYNTATSAYVTLEDLAAMVREGTDFVVYDAKTNDDLTRQILTQIIFEEESRGEALLPVQFLRQLIGFYGGQMQGVLPSYLEMSLDSFSMTMWPGFAMGNPAPRPDKASETTADEAPRDPLTEMRRQMDEMKAQIDRLAGGKGSQ